MADQPPTQRAIIARYFCVAADPLTARTPMRELYFGDNLGSHAPIEGLMMATPDTAEGQRLDVLVTLVEAWERTHKRRLTQRMIENLHRALGIPAESLIRPPSESPRAA